MSTTVACPACGRTLSVPDELRGRAVQCPVCRNKFTAAAAAPGDPPPDRQEPVARPGIRHFDEDERDASRAPPEYDDDYDDRPRRAKPGQVQAVAVMMLVGGILATLHGLIWLGYTGLVGVGTLGAGFLCCLWPGPYYAVTLGVMAIVKASELLGERAPESPPPRHIAVMQIINIVNLDVINLVLGIVALVLLNEPEVRRYFRR